MTSVPIQIPNIPPSDFNLQETYNMSEFITKDSGKREEFSTGMKRDIQSDKPRYDLIGTSGWEMIKRWAELMGRGAIKYGELNFEKAETEEEMKRFKSSALRHMIQYFNGDTDEDHAAAVFFNVAGVEMVKNKLKRGMTDAEIKRCTDMQNCYPGIRQG